MQRNRLTFEFLKIRDKLQGQELLHATLKWHTAPIIYSLKPSVIINLGKYNSSLLAKLWSQYRKEYLIEKSCNLDEEHKYNKYLFEIDKYNKMILTPFMGINNSLHLFCYIPERIQIICQNEAIRNFLEERGYFLFQPEYCIARLKNAFQWGCPHEIGVFLGYPLSDVKAFIKNRGRNYLLNGYWKVYSNVPQAERIFHSYNQAKVKALEEWNDIKIGNT